MKKYVSIMFSAIIIATNCLYVNAFENKYKSIVNVSENADVNHSETTSETTSVDIVPEAISTEITPTTPANPTAPTTPATTVTPTMPTKPKSPSKQPFTPANPPKLANPAPKTTPTVPVAKVSDISFNKNTNLFGVPQGYSLSSNMQAHLNRLNKNLKPKISIQVDSIKKTITAADIASFTNINTGAIDFNKVYNYCKKIVDTYNTAPYSRKFKTHDGVIVNVPVGDYGWKVDMTGLTNNVYQSLINFKDTTLSYKSSKAAFSGAQTVYGNDIGGTYIEIDLTNQTVHWFKNGKCVLSDYCVTGKKSTPTPAGVWSLKCNTGRSRLKGPTWDVWVSYWAHFTQGCGLHDATWQPSFGLARWKAGYGSHGCVNLSLGTAKKANSIMQVGEPVVVYYR